MLTLPQSTSHSSHVTTHTIPQNNLLSPESRHRPLAIPEKLTYMLQGKSELSNSQDRDLRPRSEVRTPDVLRLSDDLPDNFVPQSIVVNHVFTDPPRTKAASPKMAYAEAPPPASIIYSNPSGKQTPYVTSAMQLPPPPSQTPSSPSRRGMRTVDQLSPLMLFSNLT